MESSLVPDYLALAAFTFAVALLIAGRTPPERRLRVGLRAILAGSFWPASGLYLLFLIASELTGAPRRAPIRGRIVGRDGEHMVMHWRRAPKAR